MHISGLRDSKYLKKEDVDPPVKLTIKTLTEENVAMEGDPKDMKWALWFDEVDKPLILNTTNGELIAQVTGSEETNEWSGHKVTLFNDPNVMYKGKRTGGIRIKLPKSKQAPEPEDEDPEIPF